MIGELLEQVEALLVINSSGSLTQIQLDTRALKMLLLLVSQTGIVIVVPAIIAGYNSSGVNPEFGGWRLERSVRPELSVLEL